MLVVLDEDGAKASIRASSSFNTSLEGKCFVGTFVLLSESGEPTDARNCITSCVDDAMPGFSGGRTDHRALCGSAVIRAPRATLVS